MASTKNPRNLANLCVLIRDSNLLPKDVGNKAYTLSKISKIINTPRGFVITAKAYDKFIESNGLEILIAETANELAMNEIDVATASKKIKESFKNANIDRNLRYSIESQITGLNGPYAVRSSSIIEDTEKASFAGLFDTKLNVEPKDLVSSVKEIFASAFNSQALAYMIKNGFEINKTKMPVIIQEMINAPKYGVCFYFAEGNSRIKVIESSLYNPAGVTSGKVVPDLYIVHDDIEKYPYSFGVSNLFDFETYDIAKMAEGVEDILFPADIEFALNNDNQLYLLQLRRLTEKVPLPIGKDKILAGLPVYRGKVRGKALIWTDSEKGSSQALEKKSDKILVADFLPLEYADYIKNFTAIITEFAGMASHISILAREYRIPCIVGVSDATNLIKNDELLEIDGSAGEVTLLERAGISIKRKYSQKSFDLTNARIFKHKDDLAILYSSEDKLIVYHGYMGPAEYKKTFIETRLRDMVYEIARQYPNIAIVDGGDRLWQECDATLEYASLNNEFKKLFTEAIDTMNTMNIAETERLMKQLADEGIKQIDDSKMEYDSFINNRATEHLVAALDSFIKGYAYWQAFNSCMLDIQAEHLLSNMAPDKEISFKKVVKIMWQYEPEHRFIGPRGIFELMTDLYTTIASDFKIYTTPFTSLFSYLEVVRKTINHKQDAKV